MLLLVALPVAVAAIWIRPFIVTWPTWMPFSIEELARNQDRDRIVLVYFRDDFAFCFDQIQTEVLQTDRIEYELRKSSIISLISDRTLEDKEALNELVRITGSNHVPVVAVYSKDASRPPTIVSRDFDEKSILDAISRAKR